MHRGKPGDVRWTPIVVSPENGRENERLRSVSWSGQPLERASRTYSGTSEKVASQAHVSSNLCMARSSYYRETSWGNAAPDLDSAVALERIVCRCCVR